MVFVPEDFVVCLDEPWKLRHKSHGASHLWMGDASVACNGGGQFRPHDEMLRRTLWALSGASCLLWFSPSSSSITARGTKILTEVPILSTTRNQLSTRCRSSSRTFVSTTTQARSSFIGGWLVGCACANASASFAFASSSCFRRFSRSKTSASWDCNLTHSDVHGVFA